MSTKTVDIPEVKQRQYCATCHFYVGTRTYPARTVQIDADDEPNVPQALALLHYSRCQH